MNVTENKNKSEMTMEEMLADSSLADFHAFLRRVQTTPFSQLMPRKHAVSLYSLVTMNTKELFFSNPNMPIKKVITTIFEDLTDDIPAPLMLKLTKKIIAQWELLYAESQKTAGVAVTA